MAQGHGVKGDAFSIHKKVSIDFVRNSGGLAVRVNQGQKSPSKGWQPASNNTNDSESILREMEKGSQDNLGMQFFSTVVDVDIDADIKEHPALIDALNRFLPVSSHVWGHGDRRATHRAYSLTQEFLPEQWPILKQLHRIPEVKVEIRGGRLANGKYTVLPGSYHTSGEEYLWENLAAARNSLVQVDLNDIIKGIRLAGAVAVLAPYWVEGMRNPLTLALSGFLHRTSKIAEDFGDATFKMDELLAEKFFEVLLDVLEGDNSADRYARYKTFQATWAKAEKDKPVTGGATIAELTGDEQILSKLYDLLCDSPDTRTLDYFVQRFAIWSGPGLVIDMEQAQMGAPKPIMTKIGFLNSFGHKYVSKAAKEGQDKKMLAADYLFHMSRTMRLSGLTFEPDKGQLVDHAEGIKVNQWSGFKVPPSAEPVKDADVQPFLEYVYTIICSRQTVLYDWVMGWLAHIFQEPANRTGTALVLVGIPGIGKSFLGANFLCPIIGPAHSVATNQIDRAVAGFNALFDNKIFVQCDEALSNRQRQTAARLKSFITDPYITIEPKGIDPYSKPNHMRLLFTSNELRDAVFLSDGLDDRRYTVIEVNAEKKGKLRDYWHPLAQWAQDEANLAKVHRYLRDFVYDRAAIGQPILTKAKIVMQEQSMPIFDRWLALWLNRIHPLSELGHKFWHDAPYKNVREKVRAKWPEKVNYVALAGDLAYFIRQDASRATGYNAQQIKQEFQRRGFKVSKAPTRIAVRDYDAKEQVHTQKRVVLHPCPTYEEVRRYLMAKYGLEYDELKDGPEDIELNVNLTDERELDF